MTVGLVNSQFFTCASSELVINTQPILKVTPPAAKCH